MNVESSVVNRPSMSIITVLTAGPDLRSTNPLKACSHQACQSRQHYKLYFNGQNKYATHSDHPGNVTNIKCGAHLCYIHFKIDVTLSLGVNGIYCQIIHFHGSDRKKFPNNMITHPPPTTPEYSTAIPP